MVKQMRVLLMLFLVMLVAAIVACAPAAAPAPVAPAAPKQPQAPVSAAMPQAVVAASPTPTAATAPPKPQVSAIKRGGVYRVQDIGLLNLDVSQSTTNQLMKAGDPCYERLVGFRAASYTDLTLEPWLAKSWEVSKDGTVWTFHLEKNVRWQNVPPVNGRRFTSADVAWTVDYVKAKTAFATLWADVVRYETPDDFTIVFYLKKPLAPFMALVGSVYNKIYPREVIERDGNLQRTMVGTGPFMFKSWVEDSTLVLVKNPDYWQVGEDGKPLPYLDGVTSITIKDYAARVAAMRAGQTEEFYSSVESKDALSMQKSNPEIQIVRTGEPSAHGIMMNVSVPPWDNLLMRKALSLAIDRDKYIQLLFNGEGVRNNYMPVEGWGWDEEETIKRLTLNLEEAKRLLRESGYKGEPILYTGFNGGSINNGSDAGAIMFQMTEPAGFKWNPRWNPDSATQRKAFVAGNWGTAQWNVQFSGQDPDDWLFPFYHSSAPTSSNFSRVKDPELDKLIEAQRSELDEAKRKQLVRDAVERIYQQMYFIPIANLASYRARSAAIRGTIIHKSPGLPHIQRAWLDR